MKTTKSKVTEIEEWALDFFSEFFLGLHHVPGGKSKIKKWGTGYCINYTPGDIATFDFNGMTRLVFMSHRDCIRTEITGSSPNKIKLAIWKREKREGRMHEKHPTIEQALDIFNKTETVNLPKELTAENGAKALLIGEFHEDCEIMNPDYCGEDCENCGEDEECAIDELCREESFNQQVPVSWTTIKNIYKKIVKHYHKN